MLDLGPATRAVAAIVTGVRDDQLSAPTPCPELTVADLLDHVAGLSIAFVAAARKTSLDMGSPQPSADGSRLVADWRTRIHERLAALADAWRDEAAWTGMTSAGGVDLPGDVAGAVALNEVVVHGWDIAVATGQPVSYDDDVIAAAESFVAPTAAARPEGTPGLFGPVVPVADDASPLDRLLGLTGRDPAWRSAAAGA
jgi:uncharacterized protein (TIGR03086 family)